MTAFQPFVAARSQARSVVPARIERWQRIARSAAEQCGRTVLPGIHPCIAFDALVADVRRGGPTWLLDPAHGDGVAATPPADGGGLTVVIGPEGGLDPAEVEQFRAAGARPVNLGPRVLRFETAAIAALAVALRPGPA